MRTFSIFLELHEDDFPLQELRAVRNHPGEAQPIYGGSHANKKHGSALATNVYSSGMRHSHLKASRLVTSQGTQIVANSRNITDILETMEM